MTRCTLRLRFTAVVLLFVASTSLCFAGIGDFFEGRSQVFKLDPVYDGIIGGGGLALSGGLFIYDFFAPVEEFTGGKLELNEVNRYHFQYQFSFQQHIR